MASWFNGHRSFVYIIRATYKGHRAIKIGHSYCPRIRLTDLKRKHGLTDAKLIFHHDFPNRWEAYQHEQKMHRKVAEHRIDGEWFHDVPSLTGEGML